jgi:hypothetical protein
MRAVALALAALLAAGAAECAWLARAPALGAGKWVEPSFCGKLPCPPFTVDEKFDGYEQRTYEAGTWVVTNVVRRRAAVRCRRRSERHGASRNLHLLRRRPAAR